MAQAQNYEKKALFRLFFGTVFVLCVLTGGNAIFILNILGSSILQPIEREVASVPTAKVIEPLYHAPVLQIDCAKAWVNQDQATKADSARLSFKNCGEQIEIANLTNHNQGDVFAGKKGWFTSDFIRLSKGSNKLQVQMGKDTQIIEINRLFEVVASDNKAL